MSSKVEGFMIRIDSDKHAALKKLADDTSLKMVDLGRIAIDGLLEYAKHHHGRLMLPLDFTTVWAEMRELEKRLDHESPFDPPSHLARVAEDPANYGSKED